MDTKLLSWHFHMTDWFWLLWRQYRAVLAASWRVIFRHPRRLASDGRLSGETAFPCRV